MKNQLTAKKLYSNSPRPHFFLEYAVNESARLLHRNYSYGMLIGQQQGGEKTKMCWSLVLTPTNQPAKDWNDFVQMTSKQAVEAAQAHANQINVLEQQGRYSAIKYTTQLGFELYRTHGGGFSYKLEDAKAFTYAEASSLFEAASFSDISILYDGDSIAMVTKQPVHRKINGGQTTFYIQGGNADIDVINVDNTEIRLRKSNFGF